LSFCNCNSQNPKWHPTQENKLPNRHFSTDFENILCVLFSTLKIAVKFDKEETKMAEHIDTQKKRNSFAAEDVGSVFL
jgi:hypothetical protein